MNTTVCLSAINMPRKENYLLMVMMNYSIYLDIRSMVKRMLALFLAGVRNIAIVCAARVSKV